MAQQNRATLKSYFNTGDTPTEAQYVDVFDSTWLKTETLPSDIVEYDTLADLPATGAAGTLYVVRDVTGDDVPGLRVWYEGIYQSPIDVALSDGDKGDITITAGTWTIDAGVVTLVKQATGTADTLQGFSGSGAPSEVTVGSGLTLTGGTLTASASGNTFTRATLTGTGLSVDIEHSGSAPTLSDPGASVAYELDILTGATWKSAVLSGTVAATSGSNFTLDVINADGNSDYFTFQIINEDDGSVIRLSDWGIQVQTSEPSAGTVRYVFTNMSGLASGWKIIATR